MIRAAIIGAGRRGREHAEAIECIEAIELVATVDTDPARADHRAIGKVARAAQLDVVVIATPAASRAKVVAEVLSDTGARAVICEKPLALDLAEAAWIVDACDTAGVLLAVSLQSRFAESFRLLHRAVTEGAIGRLERLGGACFGNVLDQGSHLIDCMRWIAETDVEWVMSSAEDDPAILSELAPASVGWAHDPTHPAPAWMTHHLGFGRGIRAELETGLLVQRTASGVGDWLQRRFGRGRIRRHGRSVGDRTRPGRVLCEWCRHRTPGDARGLAERRRSNFIGTSSPPCEAGRAWKPPARTRWQASKLPSRACRAPHPAGWSGCRSTVRARFRPSPSRRRAVRRSRHWYRW